MNKQVFILLMANSILCTNGKQ